MQKYVIRIVRILSLIVILTAFILVLADIISPLPIKSKSYSTMIYSRNNEIIHGFLTSDDKWRIRASNKEISETLIEAIIAKEDKYFYYHPGVNPLAVVRAFYRNVITGRRTSGASTITMQVARLMNPSARNISNKLSEAFRAVQLEMHFTKSEILNMYLNYLPYGGNIEGVKAASMIYFNQTPLKLSAAQIAMLVVIPNNPNALMPKNRDALLERRNYWLNKLSKAGIFTLQETEDALIEDFESIKYEIPKKAHHLAYRLNNQLTKTELTNRAFKESEIETDRIYTTLDMNLQTKAEVMVSNYVRGLRSYQITNAAVMVVDNKTRQVLAYVGSAGFNENNFSGQVDGVRALRSPGSTLKPALYMLAFDNGLVSPKSVVADVPVNYSGYRPENFDERYAGKVSIEQALSLSLNVPAVELLNKMGTHDFLNTLSNAGFKWIEKNRYKTGLSIVLGGCGVTLEELTALYSALANEGNWQPLTYISKSNKVDTVLALGTKICSPSSAYMITEILTELKRPDLPSEYREIAGLPHIAWKTGTSYGRRDAWAIGYNSDYTVGVWVGNFNGKGVPELNGTDKAVPLLFMIFNQVGKEKTDWFKATSDVDFRLVCSETGMMPDTFCNNKVMETYLPGISPSIRCNHLKAVFTNKNETMSYCSECLPDKGYKKVMYRNYDPEIINYFNEMKIPFTKIPEHNIECSSTLTGSKGEPIITSPTDNAEYLVFEGKKQKLMLKSNSANGTRFIYWHVDNIFIAKTLPNEPAYITASKGTHTITCSDDRGRVSKITINVKII